MKRSSSIKLQQQQKNKDAFKNIDELWGSWVAQSVKRPTSAQVMISQFVSRSPMSGFVLTAQSLEPVSYSVSFSLRPSPARSLSLSLKSI